jgi:YHS domain-containing protein
MMRPAVLVLSLTLCVSLSAQAPQPVEALDGLDPVILVQGKEVFGKADFSLVHGRFEYKFASAETKAAFVKSPERYEIQMGGLCAKMGGTAGGNPSDYVVHDGRIYIFGSDDCHKQFVASPAKYLPRPAAPLTATAAERDKGRALIDAAVKALGGAQQLDGVATYVEKARQTQTRGDEEVVIISRAIWKFPESARLERAMTMQGREMTSATVLSPAGMWFVGPQGAFPMNPAARPALERDFGRDIVPLLRARSAPGFLAAASGATTVDGAAAEEVRVVHGPIDVVLAIDATSGRILRSTFTERSATGEYGETIVLYSDYRPAGGLLVPFSRKALFNGAPDPFRTKTIDAIAVNEPVDDALFAPAAARR